MHNLENASFVEEVVNLEIRRCRLANKAQLISCPRVCYLYTWIVMLNYMWLLLQQGATATDTPTDKSKNDEDIHILGCDRDTMKENTKFVMCEDIAHSFITRIVFPLESISMSFITREITYLLYVWHVAPSWHINNYKVSIPAVIGPAARLRQIMELST